MQRGSTSFGWAFRASLLLVAAVIFFALATATSVSDQAGAQETDPLKGHTANIGSDDDDDIANTVEIAIAGCTASPDATVVVEDKDTPPTRVTLTNGQNVNIITSEPDVITIKGTGQGGNIEGGNPTGSGADEELNSQSTGSTAQGTVISSTGITCGNTDSGDTNTGDGANNDSNRDAASAGAVNLTCEQLIELVEDDAAAGQYITEISQRCEGSANVISGTVPGKLLADTGGPLPGLLMLGLLLTGGGLLLRSSLRRE